MTKKALLVLVAVTLAAALPAAGQNPAFNGEAQLGWVATVVPPTVTCAGGVPTGLPFPQCSEGTRTSSAAERCSPGGPSCWRRRSSRCSRARSRSW